jgi:sterol desaturase/sphingolipid hydroxylase (fatty acid hydroxylase superfamily)
MLTAKRVHPFSEALTEALLIVPIGMLGVSPGVLIVVNLLRGIQSVVQHSMLPWSWGWIGRYVFFSPVGHRIHHSLKPGHLDRNFGFVFPIWDRLFGTIYEGADLEVLLTPPAGSEHRHFWGELIQCYLAAWRRFWAGLCGLWEHGRGS